MSTTWWSAGSASPRRRRRTGNAPASSFSYSEAAVPDPEGIAVAAPIGAASTRGRLQERRDVPGSFGFHAGLLQKAEIPEPLNEAELPGAERCVVAVRQPARHAAAVGQGVAGGPPIAVDRSE